MEGFARCGFALYGEPRHRLENVFLVLFFKKELLSSLLHPERVHIDLEESLQLLTLLRFHATGRQHAA